METAPISSCLGRAAQGAAGRRASARLHGAAGHGPGVLRRRRRDQRAVTMVEFAMVSPVALLLLIGLVVVGIAVTHQMQLNQGAKSSARGVAICAVAAEQNPNQTDPGTLPNGNACANVQTYIDAQFTSVSPSLQGKAVVTVVSPSGTSSAWSAGEACPPDSVVDVSITYAQPLYVPLVGFVFGDGAGNTRSLTAYGQATC